MTTTTQGRQAWSVPMALALTAEEFIEVFRTLDAPGPDELNGEYSGFPHLGDTEERHAGVLSVMCNRDGHGYWLGKAYQSDATGRGEGYNVWMRDLGSSDRWLRFGTSIGPSAFDDKPSLVMRYAAFDNASGAANLVDEIRKLSDGLYLGLGVADLPDGGRSQPGPFVLSGPVQKWTGVDDPEAEAQL